jgi:uncharacterized delta-60 repeat protein
LLVLVTASARAAPDAPAPSFGSPGEVTTTFGLESDDVAQGLLLQSDGRIVAVGYRAGDGDSSEFALARYNANGALDPSFGTGGKVTTDFGFANAGALQPDGRIVAAGSNLVSRPDFDFALARYNSNGTLDASFGADGKVTTTFGPTTDYVEALALQPDGRIVVAGSSRSPEQRNGVFALARYSADGKLDPSFGTGGKVMTSFGSARDDSAEALALEPDGKIVAAGSDFLGAERRSVFGVARYTSDGSLDPSFGSGGMVTTSFGATSDIANAIVLQPDGKIVVAGYSFLLSVGPSAFALARYTADGTLDPSFGAGGKVTTDFGPGGSTAWAVALQPDGKIVAAGTAGPGTFALARYNPDGSLDQSFGSGGKLTTAVASEEALAHALAVQGEGKIVAAGWSVTCTYQDFTVARYTLNGSPDPTFGSSQIRCVVPNVRGKELKAAKAAITRRDCSVGPISKAFSRTVKKGRVIDQYPRAGTQCSPGRKVVLLVSKGKRRPR